MRVDEPVDAYVADLKHLLSLSGHVLTGDQDPVLLEQLLRGLPFEFARQIRLASADQRLSVSGCLAKIRALRATESDSAQCKPVAAAVAANSQSRDSQPVSSNVQSGKRSVICFRCNEVGHLRKNCPQKPSGQAASSHSSGRTSTLPLVCHFCDKQGHKKSECPERRDGWKLSLLVLAVLLVQLPQVMSLNAS